MIGFLGTVIGMILAFHEMAMAGGQVNVEMLAGGIYTAMTTHSCRTGRRNYGLLGIQHVGCKS